MNEQVNHTPEMIGGGGQPANELNYPLWLVTDDTYYYNNTPELATKHGIHTKDILVLPSDEEIKRKIESAPKGFIVLHTLKPPKELKFFFVIRELPNKNGILTTQQANAKIAEAIALEERLGLSVIDSPFTLDDVGGAQGLKDYANNLVIAEQYGYRAKGVFLVGIPGTGKTFFPKCFAGQLKRPLVQLNISMIMEDTEPITKLNSIFKFLHNRQLNFPDAKYIILIDEIEKMIGNAAPEEKRMLGRLLTVLNDMHTPAAEYKFDALFFATANDLGVILDNNPEFLRRGRWNELFFINMPTDENARSIFKLYIKKKQLDFIFNDKDSLENLLTEVYSEYRADNPSQDRFPYTAAEIENFCDRLYFLKISKGKKFDIIKDVRQCVKDIIPIGKSARNGITRMLGQKELFIEI